MEGRAFEIARTLKEVKGHAIMGGTMMKGYADDIVADALKYLEELEAENAELRKKAEIADALQKAFENESYIEFSYATYAFSAEELLEWAKGVK